MAVWAGGLAALKDAGRPPIRAEHVYPEKRSEDFYPTEQREGVVAD